MTERRLRRSSSKQTALSFFLEAEAKRRGAHALTLGTSDGLPIASWGADDPLLMAAAGSLFSEGRHAEASAACQGVQADIIDVAGEPCVITALLTGAREDLTTLEPHVDRIFASPA